VFRRSLAQTLDFFEQRKIAVLLIGEVPPLGKNPVPCIAKAIQSGKAPDACGRLEADVLRETAETAALLMEETRTRRYVTYLSPLKAMCTSGWCGAVQDGLYVYRDASHLNLKGAERLSRVLDVSLKNLAERSPR
jgi:hypothetical protein